MRLQSFSCALSYRPKASLPSDPSQNEFDRDGGSPKLNAVRFAWARALLRCRKQYSPRQGHVIGPGGPPRAISTRLQRNTVTFTAGPIRNRGLRRSPSNSTGAFVPDYQGNPKFAPYAAGLGAGTTADQFCTWLSRKRTEKKTIACLRKRNGEYAGPVSGAKLSEKYAVRPPPSGCRDWYGLYPAEAQTDPRWGARPAWPKSCRGAGGPSITARRPENGEQALSRSASLFRKRRKQPRQHGAGRFVSPWRKHRFFRVVEAPHPRPARPIPYEAPFLPIGRQSRPSAGG